MRQGVLPQNKKIKKDTQPTRFRAFFIGGSGVYHCRIPSGELGSHTQIALRRQVADPAPLWSKKQRRGDRYPYSQHFLHIILRFVGVFCAPAATHERDFSSQASTRTRSVCRPTDLICRSLRTGDTDPMPHSALCKNQRECLAIFSRRKSTAIAMSASGFSPTSRSMVKNPSKPAAFRAGR